MDPNNNATLPYKPQLGEHLSEYAVDFYFELLELLHNCGVAIHDKESPLLQDASHLVHSTQKHFDALIAVQTATEEKLTLSVKTNANLQR